MDQLRKDNKVNINIEPINIFDFDGTLTTETWPKCAVWAKKVWI